MKIAFFYGKQPSSFLTRIFTGSECYHVAFVDEPSGMLYDMNLLRRRRKWPDEYAGHNYKLADCPVEVSRNYLEDRLTDDSSLYGWQDYFLFALRPLYHLVGKSTRNVGGQICSEMICNDLQANGWAVKFEEVPSPADLERLLLLGK